MKRVLKTYQLELKICGPVHIGSGVEISKKEYLFSNKNTIGIADISKLYLLCKKHHIENDFERFMVTDTKEDLKHWAERNRIPVNEITDSLKYRINVGDIQRDKGRMQIMGFIRDPYGNPYIPGSSIKGMLRTILLTSELIKNPLYYKQDGQQVKMELRGINKGKTILQKNVRHIEEKAFHTLNRTELSKDAVNDIMSGIIIGDSEPLRNEDLILAQKWERHVDGNSKTLNLLRESIKPGTVVKTTMTVDESVNPVTIDQIMEAVKVFYNFYYSIFQKKFSVVAQTDNTVFLGGGSGFVSKTVIYSLLGEKEGIQAVQDIFGKINVPKEHKHFKDVRLGVSPHIIKCTKYQEKEYMMGQCELKIY